MTAEELRRQRQEDYEARRARRGWEAALGGRTALAAPLSARTVGGVAQPPVVAEGSEAGGDGLALILSTDTQTIPSGGALLELTEVVSGPVRAGIEVPTLPTDVVTLPFKCVVSVLVRYRWDEWRAGGVVRLLRDGTVVDEAPTSWGTRFSGVLHAGAVDIGEELSVEVDHGDGSDHDVLDVRVDVRVEGPARGLVDDEPPTSLYTVTWLQAANLFAVRRYNPDGTFVELDSASLTSTGTNFVGIRAWYLDGRIRARMWLWTDPEPATWDIDVTDPDPLVPGLVGVTSTLGGSIGAPATYREYDSIEVTFDGGAPNTNDFGSYADGGLPADWQVLAGNGGANWEIITGGGGYDGGKFLGYPTESPGEGAFVGWTAAGVGDETDCMIRARPGEDNVTVGLILRGNPLAV